MMIDLEREQAVFVLRMQAGENRFNPEFLGALHAALDTVEKSEGEAALVTVGDGKFFSNGLDLAWMAGAGDAVASMLSELFRAFARILTFPMATAAAVNGHAFAAGGMLALAHDFRVMRRDRGYFCLPEVDLGLPLAPAMLALLRARLPHAPLHEAVISGARYGGEDALRLGFAGALADEAEVLPHAIERVRPLAAKRGETMRTLKRGLQADALAVIEGSR